MTALEDIIKQKISADGPMSVETFMGLALGHPAHGYYMKKDPFGAAGDFTTSPEISQMFGELIGVWIMDLWMRAGAPETLNLVECGPGRGTLMADIMRVSAKLPDLVAAVQIYFVELSPVLKEIQAKALEGHDPVWVESIEDVPDDAPLICLGNEFLDALPLRQYQAQNGQWCERQIVVGEDGALALTLSAPIEDPIFQMTMPEVGELARPDLIVENAPARDEFVKALGAKIERNGGAALLIDYGHKGEGGGDTFQALYKHDFVSVLEHIGDADLTSHVNFTRMADAARWTGVKTSKIQDQGAFLLSLGIRERCETLLKTASAEQSKDITSSMERLTASERMGSLFKVLAIYNHDWPDPAGF